MTTKTNNAFVATFTNQEGFASFVETNAAKEAGAVASRMELLFGTAHAVAHGFIASEGAALSTWQLHAKTVNAARADKIALGVAKPLPVDAKEAKTNVSELNAAVRLADVKVGKVNAAIHFLSLFGSRAEYAGNEAVHSLKAMRAAAKMAEEEGKLFTEKAFKACFAAKAPQTDAETWKRLADSIKAELKGNADKGKRPRQDVAGKVRAAQLLLIEAALALAPKAAGQPQEPKEETSGASDLDSALQDANVIVTEKADAKRDASKAAKAEAKERAMASSLSVNLEEIVAHAA
jgi:hypothetical protein